jgi:anti-sigma B factor antagonist
MKTELLEEGELVILAASGRMDAPNVHIFEKCVNDLSAILPKHVLVDLAGLEFIRSAGLRTILILAKEVQKSGRELGFCSLNEMVKDITCFNFNEKEGMEYPESFEMHFLNLKKKLKKDDSSPLADWIRFFTAETDEELIEAAKNRPAIAMAAERLREMLNNKIIRELADSYDSKYQVTDTFKEAYLAEGEAKGLAEGLAKGKAEGKTEGKAEGEAKAKLEIIRNMRENGFTLKQISLAAGLEEEEIAKVLR